MRRKDKRVPNGLVIWKATVKSFRIIEARLAWHIGNGKKVRIGIDPWVGCRAEHELPRELVTTLNDHGILYLNQVAYEEGSSFWNQGWKLAEQLHLDANFEVD